MGIPVREVFTRGNPFLEFLEVEVERFADGEAVMAMVLRPEFMNSWRVLQGGVSMTLLDVSMGLAARSLNPDATSSVTVDMQTTFLRPGGKPGERVEARAKVYHSSTTLYFCEAQLFNNDRLVARAMGTFKCLKVPEIPAYAGERDDD